MDTSEEKETLEQNIRVRCLEMAVRTPGNHNSEDVLAVAQAYERFILNEKKGTN